jgi:hypothetical protein
MLLKQFSFVSCLYVLQTNPYGMLRKSTVALKGNDQFEGFGIELIHELSLMLGFNYTFELQNVYGSYNNKTKQWNGMIQQLLKEVMCACDFTCTCLLWVGHWALSLLFLNEQEMIV